MSDKSEVGDVVQLKSGGVKMTIEEIEENGYVTCIWFEGAQTFRDKFLQATLQKYKRTSGISVTRG